MDVVITMAALSEIINFPKIPLVVSINEYIELAKSYSTSKSGAFVNGILHSIVTRLREEGKDIKKLIRCIFTSVYSLEKRGKVCNFVALLAKTSKTKQ